MAISTVEFLGENYTGRIDEIFLVGWGAFSCLVFVYEGNWTIDDTTGQLTTKTSAEDLMHMAGEDLNLEAFEMSEKSLLMRESGDSVGTTRGSIEAGLGLYL